MQIMINGIIKELSDSEKQLIDWAIDLERACFHGYTVDGLKKRIREMAIRDKCRNERYYDHSEIDEAFYSGDFILCFEEFILCG